MKLDQSTQVDFPTTNRNFHRRMKRHYTSVDLIHSHQMKSLNGSWAQINRPQFTRPRSLNIAEAYNKPRILVGESPLSLLSIPGLTAMNGLGMDNPIGSISRERTPPYSCNSSTTSGPPIHKSTRTTNFSPLSSAFIPPSFKSNCHQEETESTSSMTRLSCKCYDIESGCNENGTNNVLNTPEGLSWRRLHKSRAKLKATATTSELLSGFAMISMVELQINTPTNVPEWLFVMFAVCTTVLVAVHIFALMISTYILPNIDSIAKLEICELIVESPHERMRGFIELAWAFSTILGLFLFMLEVAILCWVKFWDYSFTAALASTVIVIPVLITFVLFAAHFYHSLVVDKCNSSTNDMAKLEDMKKQLDEMCTQVTPTY